MTILVRLLAASQPNKINADKLVIFIVGLDLRDITSVGQFHERIEPKRKIDDAPER
jgi:hypothetical protein